MHGSLSFSKENPVYIHQYEIGYATGQYLRSIDIDVDIEAVRQGLLDKLSGKPCKLNSTEREAVTDAINQFLEDKLMAAQKRVEEEGQAFLKKFATHAKTKTTPSGLHYRMIKEAKNSKLPNANDIVSISYEATTANGIPVDFTSEMNHPVQVIINNTLPIGIQEALKLMPDSTEIEIALPPHLAFGYEPNRIAPPGASIWAKIKRHK